MTYDEAVTYYKSAANIARALGISRASVAAWRTYGIPTARQYQIQVLSRNNLVADGGIETRRCICCHDPMEDNCKGAICVPCNGEYQAAARKAGQKTRDAIKAGVIPAIGEQTKCVDCGDKAKVYDHRRYSDPLKVEPVCLVCNAKRRYVVDAHLFHADKKTRDAYHEICKNIKPSIVESKELKRLVHDLNKLGGSLWRISSMTGISLSTICRIADGTTKYPRHETVQSLISAARKVKANAALTGDGPQARRPG